MISSFLFSHSFVCYLCFPHSNTHFFHFEYDIILRRGFFCSSNFNSFCWIVWMENINNKPRFFSRLLNFDNNEILFPLQHTAPFMSSCARPWNLMFEIFKWIGWRWMVRKWKWNVKLSKFDPNCLGGTAFRFCFCS